MRQSLIKLQADGSIIKSYEQFSKSRKILNQQDYLQEDSCSSKAPGELGLKLHKLPQQSRMFSVSYPLRAEIKMKNATSTICMTQTCVLITQY